MTIHANVLSLAPALEAAKRGGYALGACSPRYTPIIVPILRAGERLRSPLIVQISQRELQRYGITPHEFAAEFYAAVARQQITVPLVLHLDHTKECIVIEAAIAAGFTSVMIDASEKPLDENIVMTQAAVQYAHGRGVSVEAELGMIGTPDFVETVRDEQVYTDPQEAERQKPCGTGAAGERRRAGPAWGESGVPAGVGVRQHDQRAGLAAVPKCRSGQASAALVRNAAHLPKSAGQYSAQCRLGESG